MKKAFFLLLAWLCLTFAASCAAQPTAAPTATLAIPPLITNTPQQAVPGQPVLGPQPILVNQKYQGHLVLVRFSKDNTDTLSELDLASGTYRTLFQAPPAGQLSSADVSPDGKQIVIAYSAPTADGKPQYGYSDLYLLDYGASSPTLRPFLMRKDKFESYITPIWSPDGQTIYYSHFYNNAKPGDTNLSYIYAIEKIDLPTQTSTRLINSALWPAVSPDGTHISYLATDPTLTRNDLYVANADGSNPVAISKPGTSLPVDAHFFSADGKSVVYSMVNPTAAAPGPSWLEALLGIQVASAHNVPSDWYSSPITGGDPVRITTLNDTGFNGRLSPDGQHMAFFSASGLFVMTADGKDITHISTEIFAGNLSWIK